MDEVFAARAKAARRTWRFFADFVGPKDNWLPPDNFQEYPAPAIASRTSPTNIGMSLLADLAAYDFGYICAGEFLQRAEATVATMEKLERYRGHLYNWYDTRTLQPLHPKYVSSVDSGNLAGSLLTLQAGLTELRDQPVLSPNAFQGLQDTLQVLAEHVPALPTPDLAKKIGFLQDTLHALTLNGQPRTLAAAESVLDEIHRTGGGLVRHAVQVANAVGLMPANALWYNPEPIANDPGQGSTLALAASPTQFFGIRHHPTTRPGAAQLVHQVLSVSGTPVAVSLPVFTQSSKGTTNNNWNMPGLYEYGEVLDPLQGFVVAGGHAVCVTNFVPDSAAAGGGWFVFRNSWGTAWSHRLPDPSKPAPDKGWGFVSAEYVDLYCDQRPQ